MQVAVRARFHSETMKQETRPAVSGTTGFIIVLKNPAVNRVA